VIIFDEFETREAAERFARAVEDKYHLNTRVCNTQQESNEYDYFPYKLTGFIVLVDRIVDENNDIQFAKERPLERMVRRYGGTWAGT
jgi:hypothetical protein